MTACTCIATWCGWRLPAKGTARMMAITDGVAAAGLPDGATASLGGRTIRVEGIRGVAGRRHAGRQRRDDGSRVSISRARRGPLSERCRAALRDHARPGARSRRSGRHRQGRDCRSGRDGSRLHRQADLRRAADWCTQAEPRDCATDLGPAVKIATWTSIGSCRCMPSLP